MLMGSLILYIHTFLCVKIDIYALNFIYAKNKFMVHLYILYLGQYYIPITY